MGGRTVPSVIRSHCIGCGTLRPFDPVGRAKMVVVYRCEDCGHEIHLDLDP